MYVYICVYIYIHMYVSTYIHMYVYIWMYVCQNKIFKVTLLSFPHNPGKLLLVTSQRKLDSI